MEGSAVNTGQTVEEKPVSVAALASRFSHGTSNALEKHEKPINRPTRRKPPCSLPLHCISGQTKTEENHNGAEKAPVNDSLRHPKLKMKTSSPLIEKLQSTLSLSPAALMPGICPKSPLKSSPSPFGSPPSTPSSPGFRSRSSESTDESPVTFDQPPGAGSLLSVHKSRARLSLKRRPPSRRFRKSVTEDTDSPEGERPAVGSDKAAEPRENGAPEDENNEVFTSQDVQTEDPDGPQTPPAPEPPSRAGIESEECEGSAGAGRREGSDQEDVSAVTNTEERSDTVTEAPEGAGEVGAAGSQAANAKTPEQESLTDGPSAGEPQTVDAMELSLEGEEKPCGNGEE